MRSIRMREKSRFAALFFLQDTTVHTPFDRNQKTRRDYSMNTKFAKSPYHFDVLSLDVSGSRCETLITILEQTREKYWAIDPNKKNCLGTTYIPSEREPYNNMIKSLKDMISKTDNTMCYELAGGCVNLIINAVSIAADGKLKLNNSQLCDANTMKNEIEYAKTNPTDYEEI